MTDILVGGCEIRPNEDMTANLSYWTHPSHRNRGIATRAVSIACGVASHLGIKKLEVLADKDNTASMKVATNNGFEQSEDVGARRCFHLALT